MVSVVDTYNFVIRSQPRSVECAASEPVDTTRVEKLITQTALL